MNRKKTIIRNGFLLFVLLAFFTSCDGLTGSNDDDVTDGMGGVELAIQGTLPDGASPGRAAVDSVALTVTDSAGASLGTLTLTDARLNIYQIELEQDSDEIDSEEEQEQELEVEYTGPFIIDILADTVTPELPYIELLPGVYDEIKMKLARTETGDIAVSDPLYGNSIYLAGSYTGTVSTGSVTNVPVYISIDTDEEFELTGAGDTSEGFIIDEGEVNDIIIETRMVKWFAFNNSETNENALDFGDLTLTSDGSGGYQLVLNSSQTGNNAGIYEVIIDNIEESADYGEDDDGSGHLESDEDDDPDSEDANDS